MSLTNPYPHRNTYAGDDTAVEDVDFHDVDAMSMQRMYNRLQSEQADLIRLAATPDEPVDNGHRWGDGALVCNCGERRKRGASHLAPAGWPGNPGNEPCFRPLS